jgi:putative phage-type endonuclease
MEANQSQIAAIGAHIDRDAWLAERKTGIGGSEISAILGMHPYSTPLQIWERKMGFAEEQVETAAMRRGTILEPIAADLYAEQTGRAIRRQPMRRDKDNPHRLVTIDRQILACDERGTGVLEIKVPGFFAFEKIRDYGVPEYQVMQLQWAMGILGYQWGSYAAFHADGFELITFDIDFDPELFALMADGCDRWWQRHIVEGLRPGGEEEDETPVITVPEVRGRVVVRGDEEWQEAAQMLVEAKEMLDQAKEVYEQAESHIKHLIGEENEICEGGGYRASWAWCAGRKAFDKKLLQKAHPEINLSAFEKEGNAYRRFSIKPIAADQ